MVKQALIFLISMLLGTIFIFVILIPPQKNIQTPHNVSALPTSAFSLENAPTKSLRGTIQTLTGEVEWQSRTATTPAALTTIATIQQAERLVTKDTGNVVVAFPASVI